MPVNKSFVVSTLVSTATTLKGWSCIFNVLVPHQYGVFLYSLLVGVAKLVYDVQLAETRSDNMSLYDHSERMTASPAHQRLSVESPTPADLVSLNQNQQQSPSTCSWHRAFSNGLLCPGAAPEQSAEISSVRTTHHPQDKLYFLGVIDFLQKYTMRKKAERFYKTKVTCKNPDGVSVMSPGDYAARFARAVERAFV